MRFGQTARASIAVALVIGISALWVGPGWTATEPSAVERVAIAETEARGQKIYAYDQAAWHSTDEMQRVVPPANYPRSDGGWVVEPHGDLLRVTYYSADSGTPQAFFWADMRGAEVVDRHVFKGSEERALSARALRMIQARKAAIQALPKDAIRCTEGRPNNVVLAPISEQSPVIVYFLTAQIVTGEFPFGGHYRVEVGPDGAVLSTRGFTNGCLNVSTAARPGNQSVASIVTHFLDPIPTEIHVWMSLWMDTPVVVITNPPRGWTVAKGKITTVDLPPPPETP